MRTTIMGLGRFGGGAGVTRHCLDCGHHVLLTDLATPDQLESQLTPFADDLRDGRLTFRLGEHRIDDFNAADLVIANPAVPRPWDNPFLIAARDAGVPITTEIQLLTERLPRDRTIGVTGSAGKSTTSAMIHHILATTDSDDRTARLGGNIGGSLLNQTANIRPNDWFILELSSFMLYWLGDDAISAAHDGWSPHIAVLTNIVPNHLDWHRNMQCYENCKHNIFRYQLEGDVRITMEDVDFDADADRKSIPLQLPGVHNQYNARLALLAALAAARGQVASNDAIAALGTFTGLAHRLQPLGERGGVRIFNDSKSTTPDATVLAVAAFDDPSRIHLIAGGYDKGSSLEPIARCAADIAHLYTIGATGRSLAESARAANAQTTECMTLDNAVAAARRNLSAGDILLLSPGCASWDQFTNFEERGERFTQLVTDFVTELATE
jgi:UDP-N-acetylmuramoylalanine--D-glutamate ligase